MPSPLQQPCNSDLGVPGIGWDRACDLLSGHDWAPSPEPFHSSEALPINFSSGRQFLFQDDPARLPLESFWLKLTAFACLCRRVEAFYRQHRRHYLSLDPTHVSLRVADPSFTWLPARWLLSVELEVSQGARPLAHDQMPTEMAQDVFVPSSEAQTAYTAPIIRQWPMGRELPVTALLRSMERIPDETDEQLSRGLIRAHLFSDAVSFEDFSERDVLQVVLVLPGSDARSVPLWARRVEEAERGLVVSGVTAPIPSAVWARLERAKQQVFSDVRARVYRSLTESCDLYSLGMLLFRALIVPQSRSLEEVQRTIFAVLDGLGPLVQGLNLDDHWTVHTRVRGKLDEHGMLFAPPSTALSEFVWYDAVIYGLRLVSRISDFGLCDSPGASKDPWVPPTLQMASRLAEQLSEQARVELFESTTRYHDLLRICELALAERM